MNSVNNQSYNYNAKIDEFPTDDIKMIPNSKISAFKVKHSDRK